MSTLIVFKIIPSDNKEQIYDKGQIWILYP